ncbi:hypothetical protein [Paenibacillus oceani]|uniref:Uncharacterized protein n=1 Tax=Paenibacillus oceani TaxID=2772510 RepID=A0A927H3J4_9BACL|nr:hypothetical protein [Paenibacillus oceani]MBD2866478.1 hypothetical protein [Paenibacillus oceani]
MLAVLGVLAAGVAIVWLELPKLRKLGTREKAAFYAFLAFSLGLGLAKSLRLPVPNPLDWIAYAYKPFSDFLFGLLK